MTRSCLLDISRKLLRIHYGLPGQLYPDGASADSAVQKSLVGVQLPHSHYFTTCIPVLKFVNKGVFFEEIQDSIFPRKTGYFGTHLHQFGEKGVIFDVQCFTMKRGVHLDWKVSVLPQKRGLILDRKVIVLSQKRSHFELKSQCFAAKKGVLFKLENKDGYHFFSEWGSRGWELDKFHCLSWIYMW